MLVPDRERVQRHDGIVYQGGGRESERQHVTSPPYTHTCKTIRLGQFVCVCVWVGGCSHEDLVVKVNIAFFMLRTGYGLQDDR